MENVDKLKRSDGSHDGSDDKDTIGTCDFYDGSHFQSDDSCNSCARDRNTSKD